MTAVVLLVVVAAVLLVAFGVQRSRARAGRRPAVRGRRSPRVDDVGYLAGGAYLSGGHAGLGSDGGGWGGGFDGGGGGGGDGGGGC
ncbi:uncharacterized protein SAMN05660464_0059 [Geodermatophilus dictyosporus]|uniref:Uncharacterized protein n=1 Tax=Geodermatophilus dictyosporus TaxID=1523247 RepID=A0A1I5U3W1_9ACTN|nr:hypothetical protein [Geodermatophilus dictyosporus]SFP90005.1 uncharacterized protein SAMN05660464_0059 [Geodermatophilus dictyosporus]